MILYDHCLPTSVILIIIGIPSPTHSFTLGLNPSFSVNPPSLFLIQVSLYGFPRLFTVTSEHMEMDQKGIECEICKHWFHADCVDIEDNEWPAC